MTILKMLEEAGADFNHVARNGKSVLTFALINMDIDLAKIEKVMEYLLTKINIGENIALLYTFILCMCIVKYFKNQTRGI